MKRTLLLTSLLTAGIAVTAQAQNIFIDLGATGNISDTGSNNWNDITYNSTDNPVTSLTDFDTGLASGVSFQVTDLFNFSNEVAPSATIDGFIESAVNDTLFTTSTAAIEFTGLTSGTAYEFTFVAVRGPVDDNRSSLYSLSGLGEYSTFVNASTVEGGSVTSSNTSSITSVYADIDGKIVLTVSLHEDNNTSWAYLGGIHIASVPEPSAYALLAGLCAMTAIMVRRRERVV